MRAVLVLAVAVALFVLSSCAGNPGSARFTCLASDLLRCTDYVSGWTEDAARGFCETGATFSTAECNAYPAARCVATIGDSVVIINSYNFLSSDSLPADCAVLGGDYMELR